MEKKVGIFLLISIFAFSLVCADFEIGEPSHEIIKDYGPEQNIKGWVNLSFENQASNSLFEDSYGNSISLINMLKTNSNLYFNYDCSTKDCYSEYSVVGEGRQDMFVTLSNNNIKKLGFKLSGDLNSVDLISFRVQSDAEVSCSNQLEIVFFDDEDVRKGNNKVGDGYCPHLKYYGCFNSSMELNNYGVGNHPQKHCQRITLSSSPGFKLGAWIQRNGDTNELIMALFNINGESVEGANCILPDGNGELSCDINYLVTKPEEYYVCIYAEENVDSEIRGYSTPEGCAIFSSNPNPNSENAAFQIFVQGKEFAEIGELNINNSLFYENTLGAEATDYLLDKYGSLDCSGGCVLPIKIISNTNQILTFSDLEIKYNTGLGVTTENRFYEIEETTAKINSDFGLIFLNDGNFTIGSDYGGEEFSLKLGGDEIFSEDILIMHVPLINNLFPKITSSAYPTNFKLEVSSIRNITEYLWEFGDNSTKITLEPNVIHTYSNIGTYTLSVTATDIYGSSSSRDFFIEVKSPRDLINKSLDDKLGYLEGIKSKLEEYDQFTKENLEVAIGLEDLEDRLKTIQKSYEQDDSEENLNWVMTELLNLEVPELISVTRSANDFSFPIHPEHINPRILELIDSKGYNSDDESKYVEAIKNWNIKNIEIKITFREYSLKYGNNIEPILNTYKLKFSGKEDFLDKAYFILGNLENLNFDSNYKQNEESGYVYISLQGNNNILFSSTQNIEINDLPFFISPPVRELDIQSGVGEEPNKEEETSKWVYFTLFLILLLIVGFVVYILLQNWYKHKYENYLFKNKNSLYNLIIYIQNMKKKGFNVKQIRDRLERAGWNSEQLDYVLKKYSGKRTGMFEIPVDKVLNKIKKKKFESVDKNNPYPKRMVRFPSRRLNPKRFPRKKY